MIAVRRGVAKGVLSGEGALWEGNWEEGRCSDEVGCGFWLSGASRIILIFSITISMHVSILVLDTRNLRDVLWLNQFTAITPYAASTA